MAKTTFTSGGNSVTVDLIPTATINISTNVINLPIPGGNPVVRNIGTLGENIVFGFTVYDVSWAAMKTKIENIRNFFQTYMTVTLTCVENADWNGTYEVASVSIPLDAKQGWKFFGSITLVRVYV